jgi:hypothetical protein
MSVRVEDDNLVDILEAHVQRTVTDRIVEVVDTLERMGFRRQVIIAGLSRAVDQLHRQA